MKHSIGIIILAAGKGTRMKVDKPKALMHASGKPLIDYVVNASLNFVKEFSLTCELGVVVGHKKELLEEWYETKSERELIKLAWQREQSGTADALKSCFHDYPGFWNHEFTLVACADTPLITEREFSTLMNKLLSESDLDGVAATFEAQNPRGYGRIIHAKNGFHIVEEKDASLEEQKITEVNSGFYILRTRHVKKVLDTIRNENKSGEFYLTDLFQDSFKVKAIKFPSSTPFLGINTLEQLVDVNKIFHQKKISSLLNSGVMILNPDTCYVEYDVKIGAGTTIYPAVTILNGTEIGENVIIESGSFIKNSKIEKNVSILANSYLEEAFVQSAAVIGPMARLRPGTDVGQNAKVGNFVEIKKSKLAKGVKVSHLSYVGDAEIGEDTNIGCGFITCNYDGAKKHKTIIGKNSFIGSDCQMVAPISIGNDVFVAAGSTITKDIPDGGFGIARSVQTTKDGLAKKFLKSKKS